MRMRAAGAAVVVVMVLGAAPVLADSVAGADRLLCAAVEATGCMQEGDCVIATPAYWNIPPFIEVDLIGKTLRTTRASGTLRSTPIKQIERADGLIVLQGTEGGRAFSFVITEETGVIAAAVARDGFTISVFGSCTPAPAASK